MPRPVKPGPKASERPTPREIKALMAVADGCTLSVAARRTGYRTTDLGSILSALYKRLGIKNVQHKHLSRDRRYLAIKICKEEGWWPGDA